TDDLPIALRSGHVQAVEPERASLRDHRSRAQGCEAAECRYRQRGAHRSLVSGFHVGPAALHGAARSGADARWRGERNRELDVVESAQPLFAGRAAPGARHRDSLEIVELFQLHVQLTGHSWMAEAARGFDTGA